MSLIDITQIDMAQIDMAQWDRFVLDRIDPDRIGVDGDPEGPARRRRWACDFVEAELGTGGSCLGEPAVAFRSYGAGCLAVGVAGPVERAMARRVGGLLRGLRPHSRHELLITFALLESWDPQLARVIGQARIHHLIDGGHVELRDAPPGLVAAWSPLPPDTTPDRDGPAAGGRDRAPCLEQWGLLS